MSSTYTIETTIDGNTYMLFKQTKIIIKWLIVTQKSPTIWIFEAFIEPDVRFAFNEKNEWHKIQWSRPFSSGEDHKKAQLSYDPFAFKPALTHMETSEGLI